MANTSTTSASYTALNKNVFSRRFGGTTTGTADPFISGYFYAQFFNFPAKAVENVNNMSVNDLITLLQANTLSVTIPGATLSKSTFDGMGGLKWHVPSSIEIGDSMTLKHIEFSGLPMFRIYHAWFNLIRDYRTGVSQLNESAGSYSKKNYAADFLFATVKPDGRTVEFAAYMTGLFPTKDPYDIYGSDVTSIDKLEYEQEFSVDYIWVMDDWVVKKAEALAENSFKVSADIRDAKIGGPDSL